MVVVENSHNITKSNSTSTSNGNRDSNNDSTNILSDDNNMPEWAGCIQHQWQDLRCDRVALLEGQLGMKQGLRFRAYNSSWNAGYQLKF